MAFKKIAAAECSAKLITQDDAELLHGYYMDGKDSPIKVAEYGGGFAVFVLNDSFKPEEVKGILDEDGASEGLMNLFNEASEAGIAVLFIDRDA